MPTPIETELAAVMGQGLTIEPVGGTSLSQCVDGVLFRNASALALLHIPSVAHL
ncbi:hypothetical protein FHS42_005662 [Streptomyces zagrosensis]|uniref:Uncharacterized protein n=1 Tax=Streptomyces zagrosensis TaxID=1042984 RepID=A0A7W9QE21_9ACTN|nr:hypothetical protein [Streptomyces zagrosensis]